MAGIDHTIIAFKNGKLLRTLGYFDDGRLESWVSHIPFDYNRDGEILGLEFGRPYMESVWCSKYRIVEWFMKKIAKRFINPTKYYFYENKTKEIILVSGENYNVTYYIDENDAYVLLGGYGHYMNPYTHFYSRGYGEEFERKMARECYEWLCERVLTNALNERYGILDNVQLSRLQHKLYYKSYWDMTKEEKKHYGEPMEYYEE